MSHNESLLPIQGTKGNKNSGEIQTYLKCLLVLSVLGGALAIYLIADHYAPNTSSTCNINARISCEKVNQSSFARILNVPVSVFGLVWYLVLGSLALDTFSHLGQPRDHFVAMYLWSIVGIAFVVYFILGEIYVGAICPFCTLVHIMNVICMVITYKLYVKANHRSWNLEYLVKRFRYWAIATASVCLLAVIVANTAASNSSASTAGKGTLQTPQQQQTSAAPPQQQQQQQQQQEQQQPKPVTDVNRLMECIRGRKGRFFGSVFCGFCVRQKKMFEDASAVVDFFVNCPDHEQECRDHKINAYPTWVHFDNAGKELARQVGLRTFEQLSDLYSCPAYFAAQN